MLNPDHARQRARHLLTLRRLDESRSAVADALSADPTDGRSLRLLAEIELAAGEGECARELARQALAELPEADSYLVLASVERRLDDYAAAITSCEQGLNLEPDHAGLHVTLSLAWSGPWLKDHPTTLSDDRRRAADEASAAADRALEIDPDKPNAHYAAAVAQLVRNDPLGAAQALETGLALQPDWPEGHLLMSGIRARQGMVKLASRHLATAGRLNPQDQEPIRLLRGMRGRSLFRRKTKPTPWWLAPEARDVLAADDHFGGS